MDGNGHPHVVRHQEGVGYREGRTAGRKPRGERQYVHDLSISHRRRPRSAHSLHPNLHLLSFAARSHLFRTLRHSCNGRNRCVLLGARPFRISHTHTLITVLRTLAEGRIRWAFWPPGTDPQTIAKHQGAASDPGFSTGIWIAHDRYYDDQDVLCDEEYDSDVDERADADGQPGAGFENEDVAGSSADGGEEVSEDDGEDEVPGPVAAGGLGCKITGTGSRFGALVLDDEDVSEY